MTRWTKVCRRICVGSDWFWWGNGRESVSCGHWGGPGSMHVGSGNGGVQGGTQRVDHTCSPLSTSTPIPLNTHLVPILCYSYWLFIIICLFSIGYASPLGIGLFSSNVLGTLQWWPIAIDQLGWVDGWGWYISGGSWGGCAGCSTTESVPSPIIVQGTMSLYLSGSHNRTEYPPTISLHILSLSSRTYSCSWILMEWIVGGLVSEGGRVSRGHRWQGWGQLVAVGS